MSKKIKIEICANSVESALIAQEAEVDRVELCAAMSEGGVTPSLGEIKTARKLLSQIRLYVIIRPRGGDFLYNALEKEIMIQDIAMCEQLGVDGVVFGGLTSNGEIDIPLMKELIKYSGKMDTTFHRAFDMCINPQKALEQIIELGFQRVLTSGQETTAEKGIPLLKELVEIAHERICIMPGSGINEHNILKIAQQTKANEFHFSARSSIQSNMTYRNSKVSMGGIVKVEEYARDITDLKKVKATLEALRKTI